MKSELESKQLLQWLTTKPEEELSTLQKSLEISYSDITEFYSALGFLPSPGYVEAIRTVGVHDVVQSIQLLRKPNPQDYDLTGFRASRTGHSFSSDDHPDHTR